MNAELAKPEIVINLDRPRKFRMDWNAWCQLEKLLGKSAFRSLNWKDLGLNDVTSVLWAGLQTDDPSLTLEHLKGLLSAVKISEVTSLVAKGVTASMAPSEEGEEKNEPTIKTQNSIG